MDINLLKELLRVHGNCKMNTKGTSMRPMLFSGDAVVLNAVDREIKKRDVVLYDGRDGTYTLHRVIGFYPEGYVIRGDNTFVKEYISRERILAYLVSFNRRGKHHRVTERGYRLYAAFWGFIYPFRHLFRKIRLFLGKIKRKLFK